MRPDVISRMRAWAATALAINRPMSGRTKIGFALLIFLLSFFIKSLHAVDMAPLMYTGGQPMGGLARPYDLRAVSIVEGHGLLTPDNQKPDDTGLLSRAPGYSIYLSAIYALWGRNFFTVQLVQNAINSATPVLLFFLAGLLASWRIGAVAGLLAAVSHHLSHYSNFILPDSLCALPILAVLYLLALARKDRGEDGGQSRWRAYWPYALAGILLGLSVWLRPNGLLIAPFLMVMLVALSARRWREAKRAMVMVVFSILTISPITIRNYLIYGEFVPVSINLGIVLWQGIGEASGDRFGAVTTDEAVGQQEIVLYNNPNYGWWASPDGIRRDRDRVRKSLGIIVRHPFWYTGAVVGRMREMLKYSAHAPLVFRSTDTKLKEAASSLPLTYLPDMERRPEMLDRSSLAVGESVGWLRPFVRLLQRVAKETAIFAIVIGVAVMLILDWRKTLYILMVPLYYLGFQSLMHTEFRYALPMHYFLFIFAAAALVLVSLAAWNGIYGLWERMRRRR